MNIRLRFKLIALLIVLSLAGLLVFQGYWLKGLYDTLYKQMEINIEAVSYTHLTAADE